MYIYIVTCQEYSKPVNRFSTEIIRKRILFITELLEVSCTYKKENMRQEILRRDYDAIKQNNLTTKTLFSQLQDETWVVIKDKSKITKQYQKVKGTMSMIDCVNIYSSYYVCIKNVQLHLFVKYMCERFKGGG